jgi:lipopolysaccharide export system protein LptA
MMDDGSRIDGRSGAASRGADRSELAREKAFRRAGRHSLLVKVMRIGLPAVATIALGAYGLVVLGALSLQSVGVKLGEVRVTSEDLKMKNPSYFGVGADGSRYEVRAREAAVDLAQTGPIRLTGIDGDLFQTNGVVTRLKASQGTLENASGRLELFDGVDIEGTDGLKARLRSAEVLTKQNRISSKEPVIAAMPAGTVRGDSLVLMTKQKTGVVAGNVQLQLVQQEGAPQRSAGFGGDPRQPVVINADRMDFDDTSRRVVFHDNIRAQQGTTTLTTTSMVVDYDGRVEPAGPATAGVQAAPAQISRIAARSGVMIVSGADRRIRSDTVDFDMKADTVLFTGAVVEVTQGKNRMLGRRLAVDRKQGLTRLDAPAAPGLPAGRIQTTFVQAEPEGQPKPARPAQGAADASALGSFRADSGAPMDIEAVSLDVNDTQKQAIYRGSVRAQQGDMLIQSEELIATFSGDTGLMSGAEAPPPPASSVRGAARPATAGGAQLTRVETRSRVLLTSKDGQEATGDWAIFDVKANTAVIGGNVTIKRGRDVINGQRLKIDMATGQFNFETPQGEGPVIAAPFRVIAPGAADPPKQKSAPGPGGLPDVPQRQPLPAQPGVNSACPPGRQCILLFPEDAKKTIEKGRPKSDGWQPSTSPSPVYKAPAQP